MLGNGAIDFMGGVEAAFFGGYGAEPICRRRTSLQQFNFFHCFRFISFALACLGCNAQKKTSHPFLSLLLIINWVWCLSLLINGWGWNERRVCWGGLGWKHITNYSVIKEMNHSFLYEGGNPRKTKQTPFHFTTFMK